MLKSTIPGAVCALAPFAASNRNGGFGRQRRLGRHRATFLPGYEILAGKRLSAVSRANDDHRRFQWFGLSQLEAEKKSIAPARRGLLLDNHLVPAVLTAAA